MRRDKGETVSFRSEEREDGRMRRDHPGVSACPGVRRGADSVLDGFNVVIGRSLSSSLFFTLVTHRIMFLII